MSEQSANAQDSQRRLSPPTFALPANVEEDDYEVWTVRLPTTLDVECLQGIELDVSNCASLGTFEAEHMEYGVTNGDASENEQFRLLLRDDMFLRPHGRPFDRHVNVTAAVGEIMDTELAPRLETAPTPADPIRRSYSHVPQASGLKRRWMPPGNGSVVSCSLSAKLKVEATSGGRLNGIKHEQNDSPATLSPASMLRTPIHSNATHGSATTTNETNAARISTSSAEDNASTSRRLTYEENGDHDAISTSQKSKKKRKKEKKAKKAKKARKRARKEEKRTKSEES